MKTKFPEIQWELLVEKHLDKNNLEDETMIVKISYIVGSYDSVHLFYDSEFVEADTIAAQALEMQLEKYLQTLSMLTGVKIQEKYIDTRTGEEIKNDDSSGDGGAWTI